jgi:hypothetical protein
MPLYGIDLNQMARRSSFVSKQKEYSTLKFDLVLSLRAVNAENAGSASTTTRRMYHRAKKRKRSSIGKNIQENDPSG